VLRLEHASRSAKWTSLGVEPLEERTLLSTVALVGSPGSTASPQSSPTTLYVRKNQNTLTTDEKDAFVNAIKQLKNTYTDGSKLSVYDQFVEEHHEAFSSGQAHGGPAFLAWHREFLLQFEQALQTVDSSVTIPYWDFTVDNLPTSSIWSKDFMGGNGDVNDDNIVKTGPFRQGQWTLVLGDSTALRRDFGDLVPTLPTADDVQAAFGASNYDVSPFDVGSPIDQSFRNNLEGFNHPSGEAELHNRVHLWIAGSMAIDYSPNDPVFWMLHANIDRLWAQWQAANPDDQYDPESGAVDGQNLYDTMSPFGVTPASVLDHFALGYRYDTESADGDLGGGNGPALAALAAARQAPRSGFGSAFSHAGHGAAPGAGGAGSFADSLALAFLHAGHGAAPGAGSAGSFAASLTGLVGMSMEHGPGSFPGMGDGRAMDFARPAMTELAGAVATGSTHYCN
jgi:tyrosinase